jgi:prepilin-type N-terminal cleavage/methylation domain-containing protein
MLRFNNSRRHGFTLIELVVVIALLLLFLGFWLTFLGRARRVAVGSQCTNNLRMLGIALHNVNDTYARLPPLVGSFPANNSYGTLFYYFLPFVEQDNIWRLSQNYVWNNRTYSYAIRIYICPEDRTAPPNNQYREWLATASYPANWLVFGKGGARIPATFQDGTSNTIVFTERYQLCQDQPCAWGYPGLYYWSPMFAHYSHGKFQTRPAARECNPALPQSAHRSGIPVCMGDASVRIVADTVSPQTWWYACTPSGGETLGPDW